MLPQGALSCCECLDIFEDGSRCWNERLGSLKQLNHHLYRKFIEVFSNVQLNDKEDPQPKFRTIINCGFKVDKFFQQKTTKSSTSGWWNPSVCTSLPWDMWVWDAALGLANPPRWDISDVSNIWREWMSSATGPVNEKNQPIRKKTQKNKNNTFNYKRLGGGFKYFFHFHPILGEDSDLVESHQLDKRWWTTIVHSFFFHGFSFNTHVTLMCDRSFFIPFFPHQHRILDVWMSLTTAWWLTQRN